MRLGLIDIGTNTLRLVIGEPDENQVPRFIFQEVVATRLGEGLSENDELSPAAIRRTFEGLKQLQAKAADYGVKRPEAYATAWARKASNTDEMLSQVARLDLPAWILTADEEAAMGFEAVKLMDPSLKDFWMIDIGGGSTEIVRAACGMTRSLHIQNIPLGAVTASERPDTEILNKFKVIDFHPGESVKKVVALGGTAACLAALKIKAAPQDPLFFSKAQGLFLESGWIREQLQLMGRIPLAERKKLPGMEPERADILPGGTLLLDAFLSKLKAGGVTVCLYSFVHGLLAKRLEAQDC